MASSVEVEAMNDVTQILSQIESGDPKAAEQLLPLVYDELRRLAAAKMAQEKPGQTLQATALVHEAYLRLVGPDSDAKYDGRGHFFAAAAEAMRRLLVERARRKKSQRHGGDRKRVELTERDLVTGGTPDQVVALDEALEQLALEEPDGSRLVKLVTFGGFSVEEAGRLLEMSRTTAYRHWTYARAWVKTHIAAKDGE
jgi:RNA polymerase sigma factor (TIGR02999 family)